jgi:ATP-binding cassette subfamily B protein RaxB
MSALDRLNIGIGRSFPMILQSEAAECGLACLCMIAQFHGRHEELPDLRRRFGMSLKGATLKDIVRVADEMGFASRPLRLELDEIGQLRLPSILHWDMNHFVVLTRVDGDKVTVHDPATGVRVMNRAGLGTHFTGVALELTPLDRFEKQDSGPRLRPSQLLGDIRGLRKSLGYLLALAGAIEVFAIISPFFLSLVVDRAIVSADRDLLGTLAVGFLLLMLMRVAIELMRRWMLMGLNASLKLQSRSNLFTHLQNLPVTFFESRHLGDIMSRFGSQETILQALTSELIEAVLDGAMALLTCIVMLIIAPDLAAITVAVVGIYGALRWVSYRPLRAASAEAIVWGAKRDSHFLESIRGIRTVKLFNAQNERRGHWVNLMVETINRQLTAEKLRVLFKSANSILFGFLSIVVIWLGAVRVLDGSMSVGLVLAFIAYKDLFIGRVSELINKAVDLSMLKLHADRLSDIALADPERSSTALQRVPGGNSIKVELRNVSFRYGESEPWILRDVSFKVEAGEAVAIVGPSGCGKTTLLKLLAGLIEPTSGEILIDGAPVSGIDLSNYRSLLGVVMQDDHLFAGSIGENIAFFADEIRQDLVEDCAKLAAVHDDIVAMPMGYGTLIGDMGTVLSGGQKQRILVARALYRWPRLLLLDEATSHLDAAAEKTVNWSLRATGITRIVIAHRQETIAEADRIVDLAKLREKAVPRADERKSVPQSSLPA